MNLCIDNSEFSKSEERVKYDYFGLIYVFSNKILINLGKK